MARRAETRARPAWKIASGYAVTGAAPGPGALQWDGWCRPGAPVRIPLSVLDRHGPVAGATGSGIGKAKALRLIAGRLSANGVPLGGREITRSPRGTSGRRG
ncbi:helicase HerA-like domain-containing protein [Streptomyces sp. NPDC004838]